MPKKTSEFIRNEQPINWNRAFWCGVGSAMLMMTIIDIFNIMGITRFSLELFIGSLVAGSPYPHRMWLAGFIANCFLGGIFGLLYGYFFESVFRKANARNGILVGFFHAVLASIAFFPFFTSIHGFLGTGMYGDFGFFGAGMDPQTPILLLFCHLIFGAMMGTLYGPVRSQRVLAREFEPGDHGMPGEPGVITSEEDAEDRMAM